MARMTNVEIITMAAETVGFAYNGDNLKTFQQWKKVGKSVKKGETAFLTVDLWKPVTKTVKDKKGNDTEERFFILKKCHLFSPDQVQDAKGGDKAVKPATKKPATKKAATKKASTKKPATKKEIKPVDEVASIDFAEMTPVKPEPTPEPVKEVPAGREYPFIKAGEVLFTHDREYAAIGHAETHGTPLEKVVALIPVKYFVGSWQFIETIERSEPGFKVEILSSEAYTPETKDETALQLLLF